MHKYVLDFFLVEKYFFMASSKEFVLYFYNRLKIYIISLSFKKINIYIYIFI